jgi:hypothetical protein
LGINKGIYISLFTNTMANTHYSGPIVSAGGFTGDLTGDVTGDVTGAVTGDVNGYVTRQSEDVTVNSTGVAISADTDFASLTSANANHIAILPSPVVGKVVRGAIAGTGCEIRSSVPTGIAINGTTGSGVEAALAADASFEAVCVGDTKWILHNFSSTGIVTSPIPD